MSRANPRFRRRNPGLPPAASNLFLLTVVGQVEAQTVLNTFYWWDSGAVIDATSEADVIAVWKTNMQTQYLACVSNDYQLQYLKSQCLTTPTRIPVYDSTVANVPGTGGAQHEPTTVAAVATRLSAIKGQSGRGRIYFPAVPTAFVSATGSILTPAAGAAYTAFMNKLVSSWLQAGDTYVPMVVSKANKNAPGLGSSPMISFIDRVTLGTIRRRRLGRGK